MKSFKAISIVLIFFAFTASANAEATPFEIEKNTIEVKISSKTSEELGLPLEAEQITFEYTFQPYLEGISRSSELGVLYYYKNPNGEIVSEGVAFFEEGPYQKGETYSARSTQILDEPGIWELHYTVLDQTALNSFTLEEIDSDELIFKTKPIHVLSFYEVSSVNAAQQSLKISKISLIIPMVSFILGLLSSYIIELVKRRPKIVVQISQGFVSMMNELVDVLIFEVINKGPVDVTINSLVVDFADTPVRMLIMNGIIPTELPVELRPGKKHQVVIDLKTVTEEMKGKIPNRAIFTDEVGNEYYSKNKLYKILQIKNS